MDKQEVTLSSNVKVLSQTLALLNEMTILRNVETTSRTFADCVERVSRQLIVEALNYVPFEHVQITTPTGSQFMGYKPTSGVCGVSILRAGASFEQALRDSWSGSLSFGKILIQRNEETHLPTHLYSKFPSNFESQVIFLLEPMLATGGSACMAIELLLERGVSESKIVFVNFVASQKGIEVVQKRFPSLKIVTAAIDPELNHNGHVIPGLGDFGDRFYGT